MHGLLEDDRLVAARPLGPVEGDVGVAQQVLGRLAVSDGDPDAGRHGDREGLESLDEERRAEHLADPLGDRLGPVGQRDPLGEDHELVAAQSADRVARPQQADEPAGHGLEEAVARLMAEGVVGILEVVEVDEEGGHRLSVAPGPDQHPIGPVEDQLPVGQSGEGIVEGAVGEEFLELLALGDVPHVGHVARRPTAGGAGWTPPPRRRGPAPSLRSIRNSRTAVSDEAWNSASSRRRSSG